MTSSCLITSLLLLTSKYTVSLMLTTQYLKIKKNLVYWPNLKDHKKDSYKQEFDKLLRAITVPCDSFLLCKYPDGSSTSHVQALNDFYCDIVSAMQSASDKLVKDVNYSQNKHNHPGWSEHYSELCNVARNAHKDWLLNGKPKHGPLFEQKKEKQSPF